MSGNSFGKVFTITTFGESHGISMGGVIDGCPPNVEINLEFIQNELARRKPGQSSISTQRKEEDTVEFLSGIFEGKTLGTPIGFIIRNKDSKSKDYSHIKDAYRPSHADFTYQEKFGIRDYRGGGRSSARETVSRVVAGAIAKQVLAQYDIVCRAQVVRVGTLTSDVSKSNWSFVEENIVRSADQEFAIEAETLIKKVRKEGDSIGGEIYTEILNVPPGIGEPVFDRLNADLAKAMFSLPAVKSFEMGGGKEMTQKRGSEVNDIFNLDENDKIVTETNFSGGIQGGISNGMPIVFNVSFKPVATLMQTQKSVSATKEQISIDGKGRHDPCVVPRAVPIVEAMAAITILNHLLQNKQIKA